MNCLKDYIGIIGCGNSSPESGLLINNLPGINMQGIEKIADSDQQTYAKVWEDVQDRALRKFATDVKAAFGQRYRIKTISDSVQLPKTVDTTENQTAASAELRGITIELTDANSSFAKSGLQLIHLQEVFGYFKTSADITFKVIDLDTDEVLDTFTKSVVTGRNSIVKNKDYAAYRLFIGYDAAAVESVELKLPFSYDCSCHIVGDFGYDCCGAKIKGAQYDESDSSIENGTNSFGVSAIISIKCSYEPFICRNKSAFATALWYLFGAELMTERIYSDRINRYTTIDRQRAVELRNEFNGQYVSELTSAVDGINLNHFDCCLECEAQVKYQEATL